MAMGKSDPGVSVVACAFHCLAGILGFAEILVAVFYVVATSFAVHHVFVLGVNLWILGWAAFSVAINWFFDGDIQGVLENNDRDDYTFVWHPLQYHRVKFRIRRKTLISPFVFIPHGLSFSYPCLMIQLFAKSVLFKEWPAMSPYDVAQTIPSPLLAKDIKSAELIFWIQLAAIALHAFNFVFCFGFYFTETPSNFDDDDSELGCLGQSAAPWLRTSKDRPSLTSIAYLVAWGGLIFLSLPGIYTLFVSGSLLAALLCSIAFHLLSTPASFVKIDFVVAVIMVVYLLGVDAYVMYVTRGFGHMKIPWLT